jgi:hypothetical protein
MNVEIVAGDQELIDACQLERDRYLASQANMDELNKRQIRRMKADLRRGLNVDE